MKTLKFSLFALAIAMVASCEKQAATTDTDFAASTNVASQEVATLGETETTDIVADATSNPTSDPVLYLESTSYDFGNVQANSKTEKTIEFTNTGDAPLMIKNAKASCGCTVPEYSKEPIAPGEKGSLKVSYKAPGTNGKQTKTVTLTTNTKKGRETFKIVANVIGGKERSTPKPKPQSAPLPAPKLGQ